MLALVLVKFVLKHSVDLHTYAVAPDLENNPANESVWFILVKEILVAQQEVVDDYQNKIPKGVEFIKGNFLEKI